MKKLVIKKEYEGLRVTRSNMIIGKVTFDANTVKEEHYENYQKLGFDLFDEVEVVEEIPQKEIIVEDKLIKPKRPSRKK